MKCPVCDCKYFNLKDPDNPYRYYKFKCDGEDVVFEDDVTVDQLDQNGAAMTAHCLQCVWQGSLAELKT